MENKRQEKNIDNLRLLSINEARLRLGIRFESLKKLIEQGRIDVINIEGKIKIPYRNLVKFLDNTTSSQKLNEVTPILEKSDINILLQQIIKKNS
ncbi:MAG: helix-turn-helix domain-containing protein [Ignavibacteria bacterium]|nr:helix-turn-helix domain-containing protein [Ignavibacteria bacterium]